MKAALGDVRDYLAELLGEDGTDKETARATLGVTAELAHKADVQTIEALRDAVEKEKIPVGTVVYFAAATPPAGYLAADGAAVGRATYPDLFATIGTTFGEGDGETTFNLPDLMGRFPEGNRLPGTVREAGLPNVTGGVGLYNSNNTYGATVWNPVSYNANSVIGQESPMPGYVEIDASLSSPVYGASDTVQPASLTLLPCIRAFGEVVNAGGLMLGELVNEVAAKADKTQLEHYLPKKGGAMEGELHFRSPEAGAAVFADEYDQIVLRSQGDGMQPFRTLVLGKGGHLYVDGNPVRYVVSAWRDGASWYWKWSDGWLEQGGKVAGVGEAEVTLHFPLPFADTDYTFVQNVEATTLYAGVFYMHWVEYTNASPVSVTVYGGNKSWYACGQGG